MMSPAEIRLVQSSFDALWPVYDRAIDRFYARLFELEPSVRGMFPHAMDQQKQKFMQMLASAVGLLEQTDLLRSVVMDLGRRHVTYGVVAAHFPAVRAAVLDSLAESLGDRFDPATRTAWDSLLGDVRATMLEAMGRAA